MRRFMVLLGWLLDVLSFKSLADAIFTRFADPGDPEYPVHRAIWGLSRQNRFNEAVRLAEASWDRGKSPRIGRDYIYVLLHRGDKGDKDQAFRVSQEMAKRHPDVPWLRILEGDICCFFLGDEDRAMTIYLEAMPTCEAAIPDPYPQAVLFKRLVHLYREKGDHDRLAQALERFYALRTSNFHDDEFVWLAEERLRIGDRDGAKEVLDTGLNVTKGSIPIQEAYDRLGLGSPPPVPHRRIALPNITGVERIPIKTATLTEADDAIDTVRRYAGSAVRPGDIVTLSSCVGAIMEGRLISEGTVRVSHLARLLSRIISRPYAIDPFGASVPMANPLSVQTALEEVGTLRILLAAFIGGIGKLFGVKGWFYVVAGPQVAQIDDILGSVPPYDYSVMMGPRDPSALANKIAASLGPGVKAAIIDANDLGIAWAVGHSDGVDATKLERDMCDNPAGNQDQLTPLVIVRSVEVPETSSSGGQAGEEHPKGGDLHAGKSEGQTSLGFAAARRRLVLIAASGLALAIGFSTWDWASVRPESMRVPILLYHSLSVSLSGLPANGMTISAKEFENHMDLLKSAGYKTISTGELQDYLYHGKRLPPRPVLITFDDGYESVYTIAFPVLKRIGFKATAFVVGSTLNTPNHLTFEQMREMVAAGTVEIGWHTFDGHKGTSQEPLILTWDENQLRADFRHLTSLFKEARVAVAPAIAYPFGRASKDEIEVAREWGFTLGFTTEDGTVSRGDPPMLLKRLTVWPNTDGSMLLAKMGSLSLLPERP